MPKKHALLLANTEYRDGKLATLAHPGLAYAELAEALKDPARGAFSHVETLVNANLSHVLGTLDRFFARKPADDILLVYVGGHGFVDTQGELFLALKESDRFRLKSTALMAAVLGMNMDQCPSPHKLLILDCRFHSPYQEARNTQAAMKIDPSRVFAGRGLPKLILSAGEAPGSAQVKPSVPTATSSTQKFQTLTVKDFTRTLAETLRTPSSVPGGRSAFTVEDWWSEVAAGLKATKAEPPVRHAVGNPPLTLIRGASLPRPEVALSSHPGETSVAMPIMSLEPGENWSRLSGIFPLEMFAPDMATPPAPGETDSSPGNPPVEEPPAATLQIDLRLPPDLSGTATMVWDPGEEGFADLRVRLLAQEEQEKQARLLAEKEEAAQREKLEQWKARWDSKLSAASLAEDRPEAETASAGQPQEKPKTSTYLARIAALQKTMFVPGPDTDMSGETVFQPLPVDDPQPGSPPVEDGRATVVVSRDQFLNTGVHRIPTPMTPGATIMVPKEEFYGTGAATPAREPSAPQPSAASTASEVPRPARPIPMGGNGDRPGLGRGGRKLALRVLAGLVPVGLGLLVFFGAKSGLFGSFGLGGEAPSVRMPPPRTTLVTPSRPAPVRPPAVVDPDPEPAPGRETAATPPAVRPAALRPARTPAPHPGPANLANPVPVRPAKPAFNAERLARSRYRQDSVRASRVRRDSLLTVRAQAKQDSIQQARRIMDYERTMKSEALAARQATAKVRNDSARAVKDAELSEAGLRKSVGQAMRSDTEEMRGLYNRFALGYPGLKGEVVINILVAPDGEIEKGAIHSSTTGVRMFDQLVLGNVMEWRIRPFRSREAKAILVALNFPIESP